MALKVLNKTFMLGYFSARFFSIAAERKITTAGIIVIGDEVLKGEVQDTNSTYLAIELHKLGLQLKKISVIGDCVEEVCKEVKYFSKAYDYVLTTGGIGPTHDDITYEAVALAFDEPLTLNPDLRDICMKFYGTTNLKCPGIKLAYIPKSAKLNFCTKQGVKMMYPNVSMKNVYMFPGIPELLIKSFSNLKDVLFKSDKKFYSKCIYCNATEDKIVEVLNSMVKEYPDVQFGSYPKLYHEHYKVRVTIESCSEETTRSAYEELIKMMPKKYIVNMDKEK